MKQLCETAEKFEELFGNTPFKNIEKIKNHIKDNYVHKDKIKAKIDKIDEVVEYVHRENNKYNYSDYTCGNDSWSREKVDLEIKKELQELLEE